MIREEVWADIYNKQHAEITKLQESERGMPYYDSGFTDLLSWRYGKR